MGLRKNPKAIGDEHVKSVHQALIKFINRESIDSYPRTIKETVYSITDLYPNIENAVSKFASKNPDQARDLTIYLEQNKTVSINLFLIKKGGRIQPKNPGAKSFFSKYFLSDDLQQRFNIIFEQYYLEFLKGILESERGIHYITEIKELKRLISDIYPRFTEEINPYRDKFLYNLREACFSLLRKSYNERNDGFFHAYNTFFMTEDINIVTYYGKIEEDVSVENFNPGNPTFFDIEIFKKGKNTVGVRFGEVALTLRFKFESAPVSSIKLAASYENYPNLIEKESFNIRTINQVNDLLGSHEYEIKSTNNSNAIGKCHEAITYYHFLKDTPALTQVEHNECVELLENYYRLVNPDILQKLFTATSTIVPAIKRKLKQKYKEFSLESIELVPDSYISDKLNTGDIQLILKVNGDYVVENVSLKAIKKKSSKITTKNPGIGTILGPTYFNIGSLQPKVNEVKAKFEGGQINHIESLELLSTELGEHLMGATQDQLKVGITNLLGKAIMAITFYEEGKSECKEHSKIDGTVNVYIKTPSAIQNKLAWNNGEEEINLRVKFSRGQSYGWSSVKLTSEYQLK
jgi:hypothetical protein